MSIASFRSSSRRIVLAFAWAVAASGFLSAAPASAGSREGLPVATPPAVEEVTDRYIVRLRDPSKPIAAQLTALGALMGGPVKYVRPMSGGAHVIRSSTKLSLSNARAMARYVMQDANILSVQPDRKMYPLLTPNDPYYTSYQWTLFEATGGIRAPAAWDVTTGSPSVYIAVVDTGYRPHADLGGKLVAGYDFIDDTEVSNDGDGRDADASDPGDAGCPGSTNSSTWHGTHVAGIAAAASNNGQGIAGVSWGSRILPVRVLGVCGGYTSDIVDGVRWAAGLAVDGVPANPTPARVINLSLGGPGSCETEFQSAIDDVVARGSVVVVAAGNSNQDAGNFSPASCRNIVTVAATTRQGSRASFSNFGTGVTIAAPGQGILSTLNSGTGAPAADSYAIYNGTSMAAPHVAGVVALMLSQNPALTPAQVKAKLVSSARRFPTGTGLDCTTSLCGAGIVDAAGALASGTPPAPTRVNLALASNGAVASAANSYSSRDLPANANNGDRKGKPGAGGYWNDGSPDSFPDAIRVDFPRATAISEIDVFSVQDDFMNPVDPTESMTFTQYGLTDFDVQYWNGSTWVTVPNGTISNNRSVWTKLTFPSLTTTAIRVNVRSALASWSRVVEIEAYADAPPRNVASTANGGTASATSSYSVRDVASNVINGDRRGQPLAGGYWNDATPSAFPDTIQVDFSGTQTIGEIDVFSVQDNFMSPSDPTPTMTFTNYGLVAFDVQYWNGSTWVTIPGGSVTGNNLVWRTFTFAPVSTNAIRVVVKGAPDQWSRVVEIEAYVAP